MLSGASFHARALGRGWSLFWRARVSIFFVAFVAVALVASHAGAVSAQSNVDRTVANEELVERPGSAYKAECNCLRVSLK